MLSHGSWPLRLLSVAVLLAVPTSIVANVRTPPCATSCPEGFVITSPCTTSHDLECGKCPHCKRGTYLQGCDPMAEASPTCQPCPPNCTLCTNGNTCQSCAEGLIVSENGESCAETCEQGEYEVMQDNQPRCAKLLSSWVIPTNGTWSNANKWAELRLPCPDE